jgi:uncharacterized protein YcbX
VREDDRVLVTSLLIYPVKSMGGVAVDTADIEPWGIAGDRRWGLIDDSGQKITAREVHRLLGFRAEALGRDTIRITDRHGAGILAVAPVGVDRVPVGHSRQGYARLAAEEVNDWLSDRIAMPVRLIWQDDPDRPHSRRGQRRKAGRTPLISQCRPVVPGKRGVDGSAQRVDPGRY